MRTRVTTDAAVRWLLLLIFTLGMSAAFALFSWFYVWRLL